jgi:hypothetical protein
MNNRQQLERLRSKAAQEERAAANKPPQELSDKEILDFDERYKRLLGQQLGEAGVWLRIVTLPQRVSMFPRLLVTVLKQRNRIRYLEREVERLEGMEVRRAYGLHD